MAAPETIFPKVNASGAQSLPMMPGSRQRRKSTSGRHFVIRHTCTIPLLLILAFLSIYAINPTESNVVRRFIFLSYKLPAQAGADINTPSQYGKGPWDFALVSFYTIVLTFTREFIMQELLLPLARYYGVRTRGKQMRFMEQLYTAIYFSVMGPAGIYVMSRTPVWYFNTRGMYESFPHKTHEADFKFYYLFQAAYWVQQTIVMILGMEKPRKDFHELIAHHAVTVALIGLSYRFHFTYMGIAVYLSMDISDFFLAISKTLNYIDSPLVAPAFVIQTGMWIYLRNYLNLRILLSFLTEFRTVGPYELNWETQQYKCWISNAIGFGLLAVLQALNLFWLFYILRIGYRWYVHSIAKDDRSEDESELAEEMEDEKEKTVRMLAQNKSLSSGLVKATGRGTALPLTKKGSAVN